MTREYIYAHNLLATVTGSTSGSGGTIIYQHRDTLSPRLYTNSSGGDSGEQGTFPFGEPWYNNNTTSNWVFTTYERDAESGIDYALARSYYSSEGRFMSPDPLKGIVGDPQSWNRYAYVENDPIDLTDPSGQGFWQDLGHDLENLWVNFTIGYAVQAISAGLPSPSSLPCQNIACTQPPPFVIMSQNGTQGGGQDPTAQDQIAQEVDPDLIPRNVENDKGEIDPNSEAERALEPVEPQPATPPAAETPEQKVLHQHSASDIQAIRNGADSVDPELNEAIRVNDTFNRIKSGGPFPYGKDNTVFRNDEGILPSQPPGYYKEFTVLPTSGSARGGMRLVTGAGGEVYQTGDHYSLAAQQCRHVRVPNIKSILAISPSPAGAEVLFYGSAEEAEGEIVKGNVFRLRLDGTESNASRLKAPDASNPSAPVWQPDGSYAYFETDQGIYQLSPANGEPEPFWKGPSTGLAISPDGLFLAFWRVERGTDTLVLYDLKKRSEARSWPVPDRFESDKTGWDVAFAHDGHALYARTYDEPSSTPLKRFDISSGKVEVVSPDCYAVAEGKKTVYFIAVSGNTRNLRKIVSGVHSVLVAKDYGYDSLSKSGNRRWLISQDYRTKEIAIFDSEADSIKKVGKHESATVLSNGLLLQVKEGDLMVGDASCQSKE
jgi:ribonuclease T1